MLFGKEARDRLCSLMDGDVEILRKSGIMDYSLMLTIAYNPKLTEEERKTKFAPINFLNDEKVQFNARKMRESYATNRNVVVSEDGVFVYSLGIIDYLQYYDAFKKLENFFKTIKNCGKSRLISAVAPNIYAERYFKFMSNQVLLTK
jgi:hypothetical protein